MSMTVINEDQYTPDGRLSRRQCHATRDRDRHALCRDRRYAPWSIRMTQEISQQVHALQDAIKVKQPGGPGSFEVPNWDPASQKKVRDALLSPGTTLPNSKGMFGTREQVDPMRRLIGAAIGMGRQPREGRDLPQGHASEQRRYDRHQACPSRDVPVDGFWSISVYNATGYFEKNPHNAYSVNNITRSKERGWLGRGAVRRLRWQASRTACRSTQGWNYMVRLYRPRPEVLNGIGDFRRRSRWRRVLRGRCNSRQGKPGNGFQPAATATARRAPSSSSDRARRAPAYPSRPRMKPARRR